MSQNYKRKKAVKMTCFKEAGFNNLNIFKLYINYKQYI